MDKTLQLWREREEEIYVVFHNMLEAKKNFEEQLQRVSEAIDASMNLRIRHEEELEKHFEEEAEAVSKIAQAEQD